MSAVSEHRLLGLVSPTVVPLICVGAVLAATAVACSSSARPRAPVSLSVNGMTPAIGVDPDDVSFGWRLGDTRLDAVQSAYRIVVKHAGALVWDSGRVAGADQAFVPYGGSGLEGATPYTWTVGTWDGAGHWSGTSAPATYVTGLRPADWRAGGAHWIQRASGDNDEYTYARKDVTVVGKSPIALAVAYLSGDQEVELRVNGKTAGRGPAYNYPDQQFYLGLDVTPLLAAGTTNTLALVYHYGGLQKGRPAGAPGALLQLVVWHKDRSRETFVTDASWKVHRGPWTPGPLRNLEGDPIGYVEHIDGRAEPVGWDHPGFDDHTWSAAVDVGRPPVAPWTHLIAQRTRIAVNPVPAVSVHKLASGGVVADFGSVMTASPMVSFHQGLSARKVTMHAGYLLEADGSVSTVKGVQHTDMSYQYIERAGSQAFRAWDFLAFRYLEIDGAGEDLAAPDIVALARHNAMPDGALATFSSSSPTVDAVFALAAHSALFGAQEEFIDTPTREKTAFLRDGFNISSTTMRAFGDVNLTRQAILLFADSQARFWPDGRINAVSPSGEGKRDIPDFTEIFPEWVWQYWMNTGDLTMVRRMQPVVANVATYVSRYIDPSTGLVTNLAGGSDLYLYGLVDWPPAMRYGYDMNTAVRTTVNALAVNVLRRAASVDRVVGGPGLADDATRLDRQADDLTAAINRRLTGPDGLYIDGLHDDGTPSSNASQHANAYALAYGLVPADRRAAVASYVARLGMAMGPQTAAVLLTALADAGAYDRVIARLTDKVTPGWANELAQGATFTWETWTPSDADGDSMSHGWGSTVLVNIQEDLLGVRPDQPGWRSFVVTPGAAGLTNASGVVPTARGDIRVSWQRTPAGGVQVTLTVPPNSRARIVLPDRTVEVGAGTWTEAGGVASASR
jgi:alpha-L-rhamnosidase